MFLSTQQIIVCSIFNSVSLIAASGLPIGHASLLCVGRYATSTAAILVTSCREAGFLLHVQRYETQLGFKNLRHLKLRLWECFIEISSKSSLYLNMFIDEQ